MSQRFPPAGAPPNTPPQARYRKKSMGDFLNDHEAMTRARTTATKADRQLQRELNCLPGKQIRYTYEAVINFWFIILDDKRTSLQIHLGQENDALDVSTKDEAWKTTVRNYLASFTAVNQIGWAYRNALRSRIAKLRPVHKNAIKRMLCPFQDPEQTILELQVMDHGLLQKVEQYVLLVEEKESDEPAMPILPPLRMHKMPPKKTPSHLLPGLSEFLRKFKVETPNKQTINFVRQCFEPLKFHSVASVKGMMYRALQKSLTVK